MADKAPQAPAPDSQIAVPGKPKPSSVLPGGKVLTPNASEVGETPIFQAFPHH